MALHLSGLQTCAPPRPRTAPAADPPSSLLRLVGRRAAPHARRGVPKRGGPAVECPSPPALANAGARDSWQRAPERTSARPAGAAPVPPPPSLQKQASTLTTVPGCTLRAECAHRKKQLSSNTNKLTHRFPKERSRAQPILEKKQPKLPNTLPPATQPLSHAMVVIVLVQAPVRSRFVRIILLRKHHLTYPHMPATFPGQAWRGTHASALRCRISSDLEDLRVLHARVSARCYTLLPARSTATLLRHCEC